MSVIDAQGFRANVGMIVVNDQRQVLWAKRKYPADAWQFPQGGIDQNETPELARFRELHEELGLVADDVNILGETVGWLSYLLPSSAIRHHQQPLCIGQKQRWFLLHLLSDDSSVSLTLTQPEEFIDWRWVDYHYPIDHIVPFKQAVYRQALEQLEPYLP